MRVRAATLTDVPRMLELARASPTTAQWSEQQFAKMFADGESKHLILVIEGGASAASAGAEGKEQIPLGRVRAGSRFARNDKHEKGSDNYVKSCHNHPGDTETKRVEGFAVANQVGSECEIENIVVNPERQRCGLGQSLLGELLNRLRGNACEAVFLEVRESNRAARGLYEKCGFREVGRRVKYYAQPQEDAVVYRFSSDPCASKMVQT